LMFNPPKGPIIFLLLICETYLWYCLFSNSTENWFIIWNWKQEMNLYILNHEFGLYVDALSEQVHFLAALFWNADNALRYVLLIIAILQLFPS
jgi:hypothetical protein